MTNEELYQKYITGDEEAFEQLYLQLQKFILSVAAESAKSFGRSDQDTLDELCAEGAVELCEWISSRQYDAERGKLTTFLQPFLLGRMHRYLDKNLGAVSLPKDEMQRIKQAQRMHFEKGRSPDEVAQSLGVSAEKAAQLIGCKTTPLPLPEIACEDTDDDPLSWLLLDQHTLTPEQAVYRQVCTEELEQLFRKLSAKDRAILGHTYGVFGYEKLSADELGLREMLSPDGVTKARKAALEHLKSHYPGSGLHLWRDVYHALKDISDI